jgi:translation elongation factor EF-Tu-like GTPase
MHAIRMTIDNYSTPADFEAKITILSTEQGGRNTPPHNFIRWDFGYAEDVPLDEIYMIHPVFLDKDGLPYAKDIPLEGTLAARMHIVVREMVNYHKSRLSVGTKFNCHEGSRVVATGMVTEVSSVTT